MADEYEILPRDELEHLRHEVEKLKRNPLGDTQSSIELLRGIASLNENIGKLVAIFQSTNDDLQQAFGDTHVQEQLQRLRSENAKIAHGIVALSELVKEVQQKVGKLPDPESAFSRPVPKMPQRPLPSQQQMQQAPPPFTPPPPQSPASFDGSQELGGEMQFHEEELTKELQDPEDAPQMHDVEPQMPNPFEIPGQARKPRPIITENLPHPGEPVPPPPPRPQ